MRYLLTGKSGTIGKFLPDSYLDLNIRLEERFNLDTYGSLDDSTVIHLAAKVGERVVNSNLQMAKVVNIDGTKRLAQIALRQNVHKFVYISSSHVYKPTTEFINEEMATEPWNNYGKQKLEAEKALLEIFKEYPEKLLILRVFSLLDWMMPHGTLGHAIEGICCDRDSSKIRFSNDIRDFLAPYQVALLISKMAQSSTSGLFNVCSGVGISIKEAATQMLVQAYGGLDTFEHCFENENSLVPTIVGSNLKLSRFLKRNHRLCCGRVHANINL
jgi:nucleoside-diphosphate-sugar epimerase